MFGNNDEHLKDEGIYDRDEILERFIPVSVEDLVKDLGDSDFLDEEQTSLFNKISEMFVALYHAQLHKNLLKLKRNYQPYSPDRDTVVVSRASDCKKSEQVATFKRDIQVILDRANFESLSIDEINESLNKVSPYGVAVTVDLDEFEELAIHYRGIGYRILVNRRWETLWIKKRYSEVPIYRRLFVLLKPKHDDSDNSSGEMNTNCIYLKLFKNIPQHDLEMLFPNTQVKMRLFDKIKLSLTGGGGTVTGIAGLVAKISGAVASLLGVVIALVGFAAIIWRQIANVFNHRTKYMAELTKNLYFYNLNNNVGAISQLVDMAEGEEFKEAILAYYFLTAMPDTVFDQDLLDKKIEDYIEEKYGVTIDFEITDGLRKLDDCTMLQRDSSGRLTTVDFKEALRVLNEMWDNMYD
ncbi:hypothetical protein MNBD_GAMMA12-486 [hydrothermal vent metagenome]|uniref:Uncharacterized protein n=1 Tax=hydrothermal vent metagenome TaxID=652676 RepID=A0A3B0ZF81_9ZZZZ